MRKLVSKVAILLYFEADTTVIVVNIFHYLFSFLENSTGFKNGDNFIVVSGSFWPVTEGSASGIFVT